MNPVATAWSCAAPSLVLSPRLCAPGALSTPTRGAAAALAFPAAQLALCARMGWQTLPSVANYHLAQPMTADFAGLLAGLRAEGIKLRDCASFGLPGQVRMGVLPPASQAALHAAWQRLAGAN